jgi:hypothetical protein
MRPFFEDAHSPVVRHDMLVEVSIILFQKLQLICLSLPEVR